ncbi:CHAT domain-containing protein [Aspergillus keveii]|uniref:CHAT domain-containing protein n=1 Tax=Aspergillus keveii TaxID=714993 RepID=A0ABR4G8C2_9EURO
MNFMEICEVFGGSILPDELRGNYEDADRHIAALEQEVIAGSSSTTARARTTLLRAIYYTLSGDFRMAHEYIHTLRGLQHRGLERIWMLRGQMYEFYAAMMEHRPTTIAFAMIPGNPYARLWKDDSDLVTLHVQAREAGRAICAAESTTVVERLEQAVILDVWSFLDTLHFSYLEHRDFTPLVTAESLPQGQERNLSFLNFPVPYLSGTLANEMSHSGNSTFQNLLQRMSSDIEWAKGASSERPTFSHLQAEYENALDYAGMGLCKMNEGDRILSPSYTSPVAFNLMCELRDNGWENMAWDSLESTFLLENNEEAQRRYEEALFYMEAACAPRGQAAVYLRRGCVNHAEGIRAKAGPDCAQFKQAEENFTTALSLFVDDTFNQQLVTCHLALLNCSRGQTKSAVETARRLGTELREAQSSKLSRFLGTLILRFAHFQFVQHKNTSVATACCECAAVYHEALGSPLSSLFTAEAFITLFRQTHNWTLAQAKVTESIKPSGVIHRAFAYIDDIVSHRVDLQNLRNSRNSLLLEFDKLVQSVCSMTGDENLRSQWEEVRQGLQPNERLGSSDFIDLAPLSDEARHHLNDPELGSMESEMMYFCQTFEARKRFNAGYGRAIGGSFKAIGLGDMDAADAQLEAFVSTCNSESNLKIRDVLDYMIPTLAQLDRVDEMRQALPHYLSDWFVRGGVEDIRLVCDRKGVASDVREHAIQVRRDTAEQDISMCFMAQAWDKGPRILRNIATVLPDFFYKSRTQPKPDTWQLLAFIGAFYERASKLDKAIDNYLDGLHQVENLRSMIPNPDDRRKAYSTQHTAELFCGLARTSFALSRRTGAKRPEEYRLPTSSWLDQALIFLERGRARTLLDILQAHDFAGVESLQAWMEESYRNRLLSTLIHTQCRPGDEQNFSKRARNVAEKLEISADTFDPVEEALKGRDDTTAQIFKNTMFVPDVGGLFSSIPANAIVIEVGICMSGMIALCISSSGIQSVHQSDLGTFALRRLVVGYLGKILAFQKEPTPPETANLKEGLDDIAARISTHLVEPFAEHIRGSDTVIFVPTSYLNVFPLGALVLDGEPLVLAKPFYQVPSLAVLQRISEKAAKSRRGTTICAVADCDKANPIVYVGPEVVSVCSAFGVEQVKSDQFPQAMKAAELIHIAAHGTENYSSPWESTILGDTFRVLDMATKDCSASLVVFSCCLSGKGEINAGDDLVGFAHAVLQSGAQAFLGGLWRVCDELAMLLMHLFYKILSAHRNAPPGAEISVADAWHQAVRDFYQLDARNALALVDELENLWRATRDTSARPDGDYGKLLFHLNQVRSMITQGEVDFTSPRNWAPFALVGCGSVKIVGSAPDAQEDGLVNGAGEVS